MSLTYVWFKSDYLLPRHSHDTDCLYYVMAGELLIGRQVLRKGDGMFIPAGAGYAYQAGAKGVEVLEFRSATTSIFLSNNNTPAHWQPHAASLREKGETWHEHIPQEENRRQT